MRSRHKLLVVISVVILVLALFAGCSPSTTTGDNDKAKDNDNSSTIDTSKDTIKIGAVRSQTGVFALFDQTAFGPCYRMWVDKVNKDGGIYVKEYDKKMKIDLIVYDDTSDMGQMTQLYQKLITEDKVDFLLPPVSTAFLNAAVPIASQNGYLLIGAEGGSSSLKETLKEHPNFFSVLNYAETQVPAMADVLNEVGATTAFIVYIQDTHGLEYSGEASKVFPEKGIEIKKMVEVPPDIADMTPIINEAKASGADAFILYTYPDQSYPALGISKAVGYNPKAFIMGPGGSFDAMLGVGGGAEGIEGIMWEGAWNTKQTPELATFTEELQAFNEGSEGFGMDWWGHSVYYSGLEVLQGAIEGAGTLDNQKVADYIRDNHFTTVLGDTWFVNQELAPECYPGQIGQWQNGFPEVIDGENRTADPEYPKPDWAQ